MPAAKFVAQRQSLVDTVFRAESEAVITPSLILEEMEFIGNGHAQFCKHMREFLFRIARGKLRYFMYSYSSVCILLFGFGYTEPKQIDNLLADLTGWPYMTRKSLPFEIVSAGYPIRVNAWFNELQVPEKFSKELFIEHIEMLFCAGVGGFGLA